MSHPNPKVKNLFGIEVARPLPKGEQGFGCDYCPLNKIPGINKVKGLERIKGKKIFLWFQSPGQKENIQKLELVGPSGQLVWDTAELFGIGRKDVDLQNVLRCRPTD